MAMDLLRFATLQHLAAQRHEAVARPMADKVIAQYQRGLLTLEELCMELIGVDEQARMTSTL